MNNSPVLPVNPIETAESAAHAIQGTTQVQICPTGPGFGLLAMILGYLPTTPWRFDPLKRSGRNSCRIA